MKLHAHRRVRQPLVVLMAFVLAATAVLAVTTLANPQPAEAATSVRTCSGDIIQLNDAENRILTLHNQTRANNGLAQLCVDPSLTNAARAHSEDMLRNGYFSHTSQNGQSFQQRLSSYGYPPQGCRASGIGENIAGGSGSFADPDNTHQRWMNSSGHRANILNGQFREVGIGAVSGTYNGTSNYRMYTVDFGYCQR